MKTAFKWPRVVVQHGRCVELKIDRGDDKIARYTWPKTRGAMWLLTDGKGHKLMLCPYNKVAVTDSDFLERLERVPSQSRAAAEQWQEATGKEPVVGSVIKVPERRIAKIGRAVSIVYYFDLKHRDGDPREHIFEKLPIVKADSAIKPNLIVISGGNMEITRAGIEG